MQWKHQASANLTGKSDEDFLRDAALEWQDRGIAELIEHYVKMFFPKLYPRLKAAFRRGNWVPQILKRYVPSDNIADGVFLVRVTLFKLQTALHRDINDTICAIFCSGDFEGGAALFPDLNLKLR